MKRFLILLLVGMLYAPIAYLNGVNADITAKAQMTDSSVNYGSLVPGSNIYVINMEYMFTGPCIYGDHCRYEWSIDIDGEGDAVAEGRASFEVHDTGYDANVTFFRQGIYNVNLAIYEDDILVGFYYSQAIIL